MANSQITYSAILKPAAVIGALCFLYSAVLVKLGADWWTDENYSHGLLVPFVIAYIVWTEFDVLKAAVSVPSVIIGGISIALAMLMLLGGTLGAELFLQRISMVVMIAGIVVYFWGTALVRRLTVPFALLLLSIPIPQIIFNKIAFPLQLWASQLAVWGIRLFQVASVRKGNVIEILPLGSLQSISLEVVEACSGIRSLMTLATLALLLAYFTRRREKLPENGTFAFLRNFDFWRAVILIAAAVPIAIVTNAARVTATAIGAYYYGKQATEGFAHSSAGWLVYVVALALLIVVNAALLSARKIFPTRPRPGT